MDYEIFDPFEGAPDGAVLEQWLEQQGWSEFLEIGGEQSELRIRSYRRRVEGRDEFIVNVWDVAQGSPFVKVDNFGVLMDLFARWAPAVQAASLVYVLDNLQSYRLDREGVVETVAAKAAFGASEGLEALANYEREQAVFGDTEDADVAGDFGRWQFQCGLAPAPFDLGRHRADGSVVKQAA